MQKVLTAAEMREIDRLTTEKYGIPSIILMENAAHAAARVIIGKLGGSVKGKSFLILCGRGNNGGDGAALARILWTQDAKVFVYLFGKIDETKGDARMNFEAIKKLSDSEKICFEENILIDDWFHTEGFELEKYDFVIDALFGTGLTRPLDSTYANFGILYSYQRRNKPYFLSLDLPSGLNSDLSSKIGINIQADLTVTFTAPKLANVLPPASNFNGELVVAGIGSPPELIDNSPSQTFVTEKEDAQKWLRETRFSDDSYKNRRGHALLVVGSKEYTGAAVLAGNAAMMSGVGLTTLATANSAQNAISAKVSEEIIVRGVSENENGSISGEAFSEIEKLSEKIDVVGIGCGLNSSEDSTKNFVRKIVEHRRTPVVIDADGLNALAPFDLRGSAELPLILTPHEGEFLRLSEARDREISGDRIKAVRDFAEKYQVILVLKGEKTLIGEPNGKVVVNPTGNSGLGKAGNGDTLAGIITGFVAQAVQMNTDIFETVVAAVYIAGLAGDIAAAKFGRRAMLASDVRKCLSEAFGRLETFEN